VDTCEHYRSQRLALSDLYGGLSADQLALTVPGCPKWTVRDALSHLVGLPTAVMSGDLGDAGTPEWTQRQVEARSALSVAELIEQWATAAPPFEESLPARGFLGWVFTYDVTVHGDDVREALGLPLGTSETHARVLDGLVDRVRSRAEGVGTLVLSAGERSWTVGDGAPSATLTVPDEGELARVVGARRADEVVRAMAWTGDPEPWIPVLPLFRDAR
jgi:uncharacterized protein (TIGR03083 family)